MQMSKDVTKARRDLYAPVSFGGGGGCGGGGCSTAHFACSGGVTAVMSLGGATIGAAAMGPTGPGSLAGGFLGGTLGAAAGHAVENAICPSTMS